MLENFQPYLRSFSEKNNSVCLLKEMMDPNFYSAKGRPTYSSKMSTFVLLLRYTSVQAYKILLKAFPLLSFSLLKRLKKGKFGGMKALKIMLDKGEISKDVVLMSDKMYLQKEVQYISREYVGADEDGSIYKCVVVLMVQGLQKSSVFVIKACPKVKVVGHRLANEISTSMSSLAENGCKVGAVVTDNPCANVNAFKHLTKMHPSSDSHCIEVPKNLTKMYLFLTVCALSRIYTITCLMQRS